MITHRNGRGRYEVTVGEGTPAATTWKVWRGINKRWYGESKRHPGKMIDAPTFRVAKHDIYNGHFVDCASAGL